MEEGEERREVKEREKQRNGWRVEEGEERRREVRRKGQLEKGRETIAERVATASCSSLLSQSSAAVITTPCEGRRVDRETWEGKSEEEKKEEEKEEEEEEKVDSVMLKYMELVRQKRGREERERSPQKSEEEEEGGRERKWQSSLDVDEDYSDGRQDQVSWCGLWVWPNLMVVF